MAIEKKTRPYEFLVRWGEDGNVQGAHIQFIDEVKDDGVIIAAKLGDAQAVSLAGEVGFPISNVLSEMHVSALSAAESAKNEVEQARIAERAALAELATVRADLEASRAQFARLQSQKNSVE